MFQVETAKSILLEDGSTVKPLASLVLKKGTKAHIAVENDCYAVFLENPAKRSSRSMWIPHEALAVLKTLPPPNVKMKAIESQLTIAVRYLSMVEPLSPEGEKRTDEVLQFMSKALREELKNVVINGPVWCGDVVSKSTRDQLQELGMIVYAVFKGEEGFHTATRLGFRTYRRMVENEAEPAAA